MSRRDSRRRFFWTSAAALLLGAVLPVSATEIPVLLDRAVSPPAKAFEGKKLIATWFGKKSHAVETKVFFSPPSRWRHEVRDVQGKLIRLTIRNGFKEWVWLRGADKVLERDLEKAGKDRIGPRQLRELLKAGHEIEALGERELLGFKVEGLRLSSGQGEGIKRVVWLDPKTGVVLRRRDSNHAAAWVRESHYVSLEYRKSLPDELFRPGLEKGRTIVMAAPRPRLKDQADLVRYGFEGAPWHDRLPFDYHLAAAAVVPNPKGDILHFRYAKGLAPLSLFVSRAKIDASRGDFQPSEESEDIDFAGATWAGKILSWSRGPFQFVLIGGLRDKALRTLRAAVESEPIGAGDDLP